MTNTNNRAKNIKRSRKYKYVDRPFILFMLTLFQVITFLPVIFTSEGINISVAALFLGYLFFEWIYVGFMHYALKKVNFELEFIAFFLSGIGLCLTASVDAKDMFKQMITVFAGVLVYDVLLWFLMDVKRVMAVRTPLAVFTLVFLLGSFVFIRSFVGPINGAYNWIVIGNMFSFQPSEFVKIAFVFVGAATLDKLITSKNIFMYLAFSGVCIGTLVLMKDFGTALIFFFTFVVIAFLRSGDFRTVLFFGAVAVFGAVVIIYLLPHVASRFASYRHVWEDINGKGYQQTRVLIYSVSGGLLGLGVGNGKLRNVYAATTDLVFGMICEEMGIIVAFSIVIAFAFLAIYAVKSSKSSPSTFYAIAACSASAMLLFQICLNIFGITDLLPLTGVTLPFISQGGSSMICCWALFAFIKAADIRAYPKTYKV